jgi:DNA-directed RNA polymerase subunit RPC12/RpoP
MDLNGLRPDTGLMTAATKAPETATATSHTVVSRHHTSEGEVRYVRCNACGSLRMLLMPDPAGGPRMAVGQHALRCPVCD